MAHALCGDSYPCMYDYSVTLNRDAAFYTLNYHAAVVNLKTIHHRRSKGTSRQKISRHKSSSVIAGTALVGPPLSHSWDVERVVRDAVRGGCERGAATGPVLRCHHRLPFPVVSCGILETPRFGRKSTFLFVPGTKVVFECNQNFVLVGDQRRTCLPEGRWDTPDFGYTECLRKSSDSALQRPGSPRRGSRSPACSPAHGPTHGGSPTQAKCDNSVSLPSA